MAAGWKQKFNEEQLAIIGEKFVPKDADDWKKKFTSEQLAYLAEHFVLKAPPPHPASFLPRSSFKISGRWADEPVHEPMQLPAAASSASSISTGVAGKVEGTEGAATHADNGDCTVTPLTPEPSEDEGNPEEPHPSRKYTCDGNCRDADGEPLLYERSVMIIKGWPEKPGGPYVPGRTWQGSCNLLCFDCYIEKFENDATPQDIQDLQFSWKRTCKKTHRKAEKYNRRKLKKAQEDRPEKIRKKLSEQQQKRCNQWSAAARDVHEKYPELRNRAYRSLVLKQVQTMIMSFRKSLSVFGEEAETAIQEAAEARVAHLTKLSKEGVCDKPDGKVLKDFTLQFLSDLTPDGKNKELFMCRGCGFVTHNHEWHQAKGPDGLKHHFRCRRCHREYEPWKKDKKFCRFNKVLVNQDPADDTKLIATPAWWEETSEQLFVNILKEFSMRVKVGTAEMDKVTYENVTNIITEKVHKSYCQGAIFEKVNVPGPFSEQVACLSNCKGYEHCNVEPTQIEGFFMKNHMDITDDEVFRDFEILCNELTHCLKMYDA